jgi:hypothetical protein
MTDGRLKEVADLAANAAELGPGQLRWPGQGAPPPCGAPAQQSCALRNRNPVAARARSMPGVAIGSLSVTGRRSWVPTSDSPGRSASCAGFSARRAVHPANSGHWPPSAHSPSLRAPAAARAQSRVSCRGEASQPRGDSANAPACSIPQDARKGLILPMRAEAWGLLVGDNLVDRLVALRS